MIYLTLYDTKMELLSKKCSRCKVKSSAAKVLDSEEISIMEKGCSLVHFEKGEIIYKEAMPAHHILYIRSGYVKLIKKGAAGKNITLNISGSGAYLGLQNLNRK